MSLNHTTSSPEGTRENILAAAHSLFLEQGYHGTSMRQIAREADIAVGGIYNHFPRKEAIFKTILLERHPYYDLIPAIHLAYGETLSELLRDAAHRMVDAIGERKDFLNLMFIELVEFDGEHIPDLFDIFFPQVLVFAQRLLQKDGSLRNIPIPVIVRAFLGLFFSYVITELLMGSRMPPEMHENSLDYMVDIFLYGVLQPE